MSEVEETIQRIKSLKQVEGIIIMNNEGLTIRSTFTGTKKEDGELYAKNVFQLSLKAKSIIRDLEPTNDLTFLRIKSKRFEVMVAPDRDFMLIVVQDYKGDKKDEND